MEARTLPLDIWRMRESRVLMYVFWRERERERERIALQNCPRTPIIIIIIIILFGI